jgi:hypothetical protein
MATINFRRNTITQLRDGNGNMIQDHEGKATLLFHAYKNRMGIIAKPQMVFYLSRLIIVIMDLSSLVVPILQEEIDRVIKLILVDKAPGPDGFNGLFMKKCWSIIEADFYKLC